MPMRFGHTVKGMMHSFFISFKLLFQKLCDCECIKGQYHSIILLLCSTFVYGMKSNDYCLALKQVVLMFNLQLIYVKKIETKLPAGAGYKRKHV